MVNYREIKSEGEAREWINRLPADLTSEMRGAGLDVEDERVNVYVRVDVVIEYCRSREDAVAEAKREARQRAFEERLYASIEGLRQEFSGLKDAMRERSGQYDGQMSDMQRKLADLSKDLEFVKGQQSSKPADSAPQSHLQYQTLGNCTFRSGGPANVLEIRTLQDDSTKSRCRTAMIADKRRKDRWFPFKFVSWEDLKDTGCPAYTSWYLIKTRVIGVHPKDVCPYLDDPPKFRKVAGE